MAAVTAKMVKDLREMTGAGMMDCKKALSATDGDMDKAVEFLREKGLAGAEKKAGRIAAEGIVDTAMAADEKNAVIVEVNAETDFVAKNEKFQNYVADVAAQAMNTTAADIDAFLAEAWALDTTKTVKEALAAQIAVIGENMNIRRFAQVTEENGFVASYTHMGGKIGVLVDVETDVVNDAVKEMAKNVAMQIAALKPQYTSDSEVSAEYIEHEKEILMAQIQNDPKESQKPAKVIEGMITGRIKKELKEICLLDQVYVKAEDGKQLSRIYGTAFPKASMLDEFLKQQEEAKLRDHNKLGRELEYFTTVDYVGQGLPILLPKGARVVQLLQRWVEDVEQSKGCLLTKTPLLAKRDLYKISGHWDHYLDGMFVLGDPHDEEKECFALRPMTCPFQYQVYLNKQRSYRDLPMRLTETSTLFRNEASGEMHGLIRVRQFTISEGHYILRPDQLEQEFKGCLELAKYFLDTVGLLENCTFRFSQWDPENKNNKYEGTKEQWEESQAVMKTILDDLDVDYEVGIDEAAFYGPKLDIQYKNVFGKEDTIVTIQIDMLLAEKFGMYYIDKDGQKKLPYIIHRTSLGCFERTLAYMIERFAGVMPLWLAPEQIRLLPIKEGNVEYAQGIADRLTSLGMRVTVDSRDENIGPKIKAARLERIPYILVIGDNEMNSSTVTVRSRKRGEIPNMPVDEFVALVKNEVDTKEK